MATTLETWKALQKHVKVFNSSNIKKLYMKNGLLAINKPYGLPVHGGPKVKYCMENLFPGIEHKHKLPAGSLALAHRLDKNTSGVLLLTYTKDMARKLADMYKKHEIEKKYLAILLGSRGLVKGVLKGNLTETKTANGHYKQTVVEDDTDTNSTISTSYSILDNSKKTCMLCEFKTTSGYKHQIRTHAHELLFSPILGDHLYHDEIGPQILPVRLIQMLRMRGVDNQDVGSRHIRPWQRGLVPMHLLAQSVTIPGLDNGEDVFIETTIPPYFQKTMDCCDLVLNREEVDEIRRNKKRRRLQRVLMNKSKQPYVSKDLTSYHAETSM